MRTAILGAALALSLLACRPALAQRGGNSWENQGNLPVSPEVLPDHRVTFRLYAPKATEVLLVGAPILAITGGPKPFTKDDKGLWTITIGPVPPGYYNYGFAIDGGIRSPDPANPDIEQRMWGHTSYFIVKGDQPQIFEPRPGVPHGTVHINTYDSKSLNQTRRMFVYTPPGYEDSSQKYPTLYLLHGSGLLEEAWVETGQANLILDNLLADKKILPMVVVMPFGHTARAQADQSRGRGAAAGGSFDDDLLNDVMPLIEHTYHVLSDRDHRAIAGLSMGANQALSIGLRKLDLFSAIGAFSGNGGGNQLTSMDPAVLNAKLKVLFLGVGKSDPVFAANSRTADTLTQKKIDHVFDPCEGAHIWPVWQYDLTKFTPLLFRDSAAAPAQ